MSIKSMTRASYKVNKAVLLHAFIVFTAPLIRSSFISLFLITDLRKKILKFDGVYSKRIIDGS